MTQVARLAAAVLVGCLTCPAARGEAAADAKSSWPCWRGPTHSGLSDDVPTKLAGVKLLWKEPMAGPCSAGVSAAEGHVVVADGNPRYDYYHCFDAETGKEAWCVSVRNGRKLDYNAAPRATPVIHEGKVFCVGAFGDVHCLDLKTGRPVWRKHYVRDFGAGKTPTWGYCTAPLIVEGKLILHPGDLVALEPATGKLVWRAKTAGPNYSSFAVATFGDIRQLVGYDARSLSGWDAKTGKRLWALEVDNSKGYIVPQPVPVGQKLLVTSEDEDTRLYGFDEAGKLVSRPQAENEDLAPEMATPTVQGTLALGICEGLICMDLNAGLKTLWIHEKEEAFYGLSHVVAAKDRALVFGENGTMVLVKARPDKCEILGKAKLCRQTWAHPALLSGKVYIRDEKTFYCYRLLTEPAEGAGAAGQ